MTSTERFSTTTRFLTLEEELLLYKQTVIFGNESAEAGLPTVNCNLERLVDLAKNSKTPTFIPANFLESASTRLWETGIDIANIFDLYKKWFQFYIHDAKTRTASDTINDIQSSFANLAGKFTAEEKDPAKQKQTLVKSIDFIDKNSSDQQSKVEYMMFYGKYLFEHGMEKEGRKIVETTAKLSPKTIEKLIDLKAILIQVSEE